jgi:hypothetical protein
VYQGVPADVLAEARRVVTRDHPRTSESVEDCRPFVGRSLTMLVDMRVPVLEVVGKTGG